MCPLRLLSIYRAFGSIFLLISVEKSTWVSPMIWSSYSNSRQENSFSLPYTRALFEQYGFVIVFTNLDSMYNQCSFPPNTWLVSYVRYNLMDPSIFIPHDLDKRIPNLAGLSITTYPLLHFLLGFEPNWPLHPWSYPSTLLFWNQRSIYLGWFFYL